MSAVGGKEEEEEGGGGQGFLLFWVFSLLRCVEGLRLRGGHCLGLVEVCIVVQLALKHAARGTPQAFCRPICV